MAGAAVTSNEISGGLFFSTVIQGHDITVQLPPQVTALHGLPAASPLFSGREADMDALLAQLAPTTVASDERADAAGQGRMATIVVVTAVGGLAGVGKTELALQAARSAGNKGWFPGGMLFVDMFGYDPALRLQPGQALEGFLRALGVPGEHIPPGTQDRARLYASILASYAQAQRRILVVIDNASTHEQVKPLLPTDGYTAAIVTSRHTLAMLDARLIDLDILDINAAISLLDKALRTARPSDSRITEHPRDAADIARLCGGLPLALRIVAALLADDIGVAPSSMASALRDIGSRLRAMSYGETAVQAAFELSYGNLECQNARIFRLLSLNPGPEISTEAAAALSGHEFHSTRRSLEDLARAHLIDCRTTAYGRWRMHDLVRSFATDKTAHDPGRQAAVESLYTWYTIAVNAADEMLRPGRVRLDISAHTSARLPTFHARNDALAWCEAEQANLVSIVLSAGPQGLGHLTWSIPLSMWGFLTQSLSWSDWIDAHQLAAQAAAECGAYAGQGWLLNNLGTGYRVLGNPEQSRAAFVAGIEVRRRLGDLHGQGDSLKDMAMAARVWREWDEALRLAQEALDILEVLTTPDRSGLASTYDTIAICLSHLGRLDEATDAVASALAIWEDLGGRRDDRACARSMMVMADIAERREQYSHAVTAYTAALEVFECIHDIWDQADALRKLGDLHMGIGQISIAVDYLRRATDCFNKLGAKNKVDEITSQIRQLFALA